MYQKHVKALRAPLETFCKGNSGSTYGNNSPNMGTWFRQHQGSGRVLTLSGNINQQVSRYIKHGYPVLNNSRYRGSSKKKSGHSVVVTKIKERSSRYKSCRKVGWWWGRKTKCDWKTAYDYEWYRRMGWGGSENKFIGVLHQDHQSMGPLQLLTPFDQLLNLYKHSIGKVSQIGNM